jgi:outer membrane protein
MRLRLSSFAVPRALLSTVAAVSLLAAVPSEALALQPIGEFFASAKSRNPSNVEAQYLADQRSGEADQAWGRVFPAFTARGVYTRNQYEVEISIPTGPTTTQTATITPQNQLDAFFTLDVPIIDVAGWTRVAAARSLAAAARERARAGNDEVSRAVAQRYYQVLAAEALIESAARTVSAGEENRRIAGIRKDQGAATELDVQRANAEVERARQLVADAELLRAVSRNALESLTGVVPSAGAPPLADDLTDEAPLTAWGGADTSPLPSVRAAELERRAAAQNATAAKAALIPVIAASATERITNASGFSGQTASWQATLSATWRIDYGVVGGIRATNAAAAAAEARRDSSRTAARDRIHDSWQQVRAQIAKSRAARAQAQAAAVAARIAKDRYQGGVGTQLELIQADRDASAAEVARIQADAELVLARTLLRVGAGRPVTTLAGGGTSLGGDSSLSAPGDASRPAAPAAPAPAPGGPTTAPPGTPTPAPPGAPAPPR